MEQQSKEESSATVTIAELNNQGADCYDQGDYQNALRSFRYSLELCLAKCTNESNAATRNSNVARPRTEDTPSARLPTKRPPLTSRSARIELPKRERHSRVPQHMLATEDNDLFVYHKVVFRMPVEACSTDDFVTEDTKDRWRAAICVFNCALVFQQLQAPPYSRDGAQRLQHLEKSLTLYKQAFSLLQDKRGDHIHTTGNPLIDLLWLASLNNVAVILSCELHRHSDAQEFLHDLLSRTKSFQAINCYDCDHESAASSISRMEQDVEIFLLNCVTLLFGGPTVTAAAA